jgi:phage terminase small subunit
MPRPPTPLAILEARGAFIKHPERRRARANEPKPSGELGNAPSYFTKDERKIWKELKEMCLPGVLANSDRWAVETACTLMAKQRKREIKTQEVQLLLSLLGKLGMTPADRAKVTAVPQPAEQVQDEWAEFLPQKTM